MEDLVTRRQLLFRQDDAAHAAVLSIRPPWALSGESFAAKCTRCMECIRVCPENILKTDSMNLPMVDFSLGECTFCEDCVKACHDAALVISTDAEPWTHKVEISENCIANNGVVCRICEDQCEPRAIRFRPALGGTPAPDLNADDCTGCGACIAPCPSAAVSVSQQSIFEGA